MKNIEDFCSKKGVTPNFQEAFIAYIRSDYAHKFHLSNGETTKLVVSKMNEEEIEKAWVDFTSEFKKFLTKTT